MAWNPKQLKDAFGQLEPMASLSAETVSKLAESCPVEHVEAGTRLFKAGDSDNASIYLLRGSVKLIMGDEGKAKEQIIAADTPDAKYPMGDRQPRQITALTETVADVVRIDNNVLDTVISDDQLASSRAAVGMTEAAPASVEGAGGFIGKLLGIFKPRKEVVDTAEVMKNFRSPLLDKLPQENRDELFKRMEQVYLKPGTTVIRQGAEGDYFYMIATGTCVVTRQADKDGAPVVLAELGAGQSFGEEALISNAKRNATITMKTKGVLLRLSKKDFTELLKEPLLNWLSAVEAQQSIKQGAKWLDVRSEIEYQQSHLPGAVSMPLHTLRSRMAELEPQTLYICCCETGRLSSSAAFLMSQRNFKVAVLRGGLQRLTSGAR
ncbi:MAG: cyclic nucleotide-binding domain-containing protein [Lentisphaerae bacterium]|nr:cyclic nucleotide-binding domain-containing protein [Lentisphaerota bacterium]